jgi:ABC-type polar amino acid transport system ATPase subunit
MSNTAPILVEFRGVKNFGSFEVLKGIDLEVSAGEVMGLVGRSGSDKSTALRCVNGLERVSGGSPQVCGRAIQLVTHEMAFASSVASKIAFMRQGTVWESGSGAMLRNPATPELKQFVGNGF